MQKIINAVGYARYSTDFQTENSIAYQTNAIEKYCTENNINLLKVYTDEAMTGTNTNRPGFQAMLLAAHQKLFDAVVIYDISRGSRNVSDWFEFRGQMATLGISVISVNQPLGDALDPNNFLLELINVGLGQHMVLDTRKKSIAGKTARAREGVFCGGTAPLGYDIIEGKYVINSAEAQTVRAIFSMYADGKSYDYILNHLDSAKGKLGRPLGKNSFHSILKNERYIGTYTWNKRRVKVMGKWAGGTANPDLVRIENAIPPIIDNDTWERVQKRMKDRKHNASHKAKRRYLLTGLIECEACGSTFIGHTSTNKKGYSTSYYVCGNKYRTHACKTHNLNADQLEAFVVTHLKHYLSTLDYSVLADEICKQVNGASADLTAEKRELVEIEKKINNGVRAILSGMEIPELQNEVDKLRVRKSELEDIINYKSRSDKQLDRNKLIEMLKHYAENIDKMDIETVIKQFITKIYAHADGSVTVNVGVHTIGCEGWT